MAFDVGQYKPEEPRYYPVILLLDVSGSMNAVEGDFRRTGQMVYSDGQTWEVVEGGTTRLAALQNAVSEMVSSFATQRTREKMVKVAIITFGGSEAKLYTPYTDVTELQAKGVPNFIADGETPLDSALIKAKEMIEDKELTPGRWYVPSVVLVSDGEPNTGWETPFRDFIQNGRSSKCLRISVPIGTDANFDIMERFAGDRAQVFFAADVSSIADAFKNVVISVTKSQKLAKTIATFSPTVKRSIQTTVKRTIRHNDDDD